MSAWPLAGVEAVFRWLLEASWQASVLALLVLALQRMLRARLNPRWSYALWLVVLLRLLMPALPTSAFSLFRWAPAAPTELVTLIVPAMVASSGDEMAPSLPLAPVHSFSLFSILALIWLGGAVVLALATWQVNRRFSRQVGSSPEVSDSKLLALFSEARIELGIRRPLRLIESRHVTSPALMGLFRPALLLPTDTRARFSDLELRFIFLHEMAHLKRGDLLVQWLIALLQILHWFNPVLWFAFRRIRNDREPATDALVLSRTGEGEKEHYGLMLIKLMEHFQQRHSIPTLVGILEDKDEFKRRFSLIARFTQGAYGWSVLGILLIGILGAACLTKSKVTEATTAPLKSSAEAPAKIPPGFVRISAKILQISDADYQAHRSEIDAAVQKGDIEPLAHLKSFDLLSEPAVLMRAGEQGVVEAVRAFPYAIQYEKDKNGKMTATDFKKQDLGVILPLSSTIKNGKIVVTGSLTVRTLQGWIPSGDSTYQPLIQTRRIPLASVTLDSGQTIGLQAPNLQSDAFNPEAVFGPNDTYPKRSEALCRLFLFLTARAYTDLSTITTTLSPYPVGIAIPGKPGFAKSPYALDAGPVDLRGYPPGTAIRCPYTNKIFIAPPGKASLPGDPPLGVTIVGHAKWPADTEADMTKTTGNLTSVDGRHYEFSFKPDGSFEIPHVLPGVYNRTIRYVRKSKPDDVMDPEVREVPLGPIAMDSTVGPGTQLMDLTLIDPFQPLPPHSVQVELKLVEIDEDVYQANQRVIDAGIDKGDLALFKIFNSMKGVSLLSAPSVTTQPGLKADIDIVQKFPYPTHFDNPKEINEELSNGQNITLQVPPTPRGFATQDIGVHAEMTASLDQDKIILSGKFSITDFEGFTKSKWAGTEINMPSFQTNETLFFQALKDGEIKWLWVPGTRYGEEKINPVKKRMLLCVIAQTVK